MYSLGVDLGAQNIMKMIAIDFGDARTGVAVCDPLEMLASPFKVIKKNDR